MDAQVRAQRFDQWLVGNGFAASQRLRAAGGKLDLANRSEEHHVRKRFFHLQPMLLGGGRERAAQRAVCGDQRFQPLRFLTVLALAPLLDALQDEDPNRQQHDSHDKRGNDRYRQRAEVSESQGRHQRSNVIAAYRCPHSTVQHGQCAARPPAIHA
ncbi:hypothetical protein HLB44_10085 [Aquincola sp. S2]|uniref:Uncharacterized protein n=1 Tax=Pseudaquabacterium terrae TaxID=2732868 RepID=A0ABX2EFF6_9BURK|nr:hypothetical protein [Aquabacterium terrae]